MGRVKWIAGIAAAILLGALGSGLWDVFLKRFSFWCVQGLYSIATLGLTRLQDTAYVMAARGFAELPSLMLLILLPLAAFGVFSRFLFRRSLMRLQRRIASASGVTLERALRRVSLAGVGVSFFLLLQVLQVVYVNSVIARFQRRLAILGPSITLQEEREYRARFANMKSRQHYQDLLDTLDRKAKDVKINFME